MYTGNRIRYRLHDTLQMHMQSECSFFQPWYHMLMLADMHTHSLMMNELRYIKCSIRYLRHITCSRHTKYDAIIFARFVDSWALVDELNKNGMEKESKIQANSVINCCYCVCIAPHKNVLHVLSAGKYDNLLGRSMCTNSWQWIKKSRLLIKI